MCIRYKYYSFRVLEGKTKNNTGQISKFIEYYTMISDKEKIKSEKTRIVFRRG